MLLVIENKNDPAGPVAAEVGGAGGTELAYIPVITVELGWDERQARLKFAVDRMSFEHRRKEAAENLPPPSEKLVPLFLKALRRAGGKPSYLSPSAMKKLKTGPENLARFSAQG